MDLALDRCWSKGDVVHVNMPWLGLKKHDQ